jgi:hypothetical protein
VPPEGQLNAGERLDMELDDSDGTGSLRPTDPAELERVARGAWTGPGVFNFGPSDSDSDGHESSLV